jgi:hypothetical protein
MRKANANLLYVVEYHKTQEQLLLFTSPFLDITLMQILSSIYASVTTLTGKKKYFRYCLSLPFRTFTQGDDNKPSIL